MICTEMKSFDVAYFGHNDIIRESPPSDVLVTLIPQTPLFGILCGKSLWILTKYIPRVDANNLELTV